LLLFKINKIKTKGITQNIKVFKNVMGNFSFGFI